MMEAILQSSSHWPEMNSRACSGRARTVVLIIIGVVLGFPIVAVLAWQTYMGFALRKAMEEVRSQGLPITLEELEAWYAPVPIDENPALVLWEAFVLYDITHEDDSFLPFYRKDWDVHASLTRPVRDAARVHLAANKAFLAKVHEAAKMPRRARYPIRLIEGAETELPHLVEIRNVLRMLSLEAILAAADGDSETASVAFRDSIAVAETLKDEPLLLSQLVRIVCLGLAVESLQHMLSFANFRPSELQVIREALLSASFDSMIYDALVGARCLGIGAPDKSWFEIEFMGGDPLAGVRGIERLPGFAGYMDLERINALPEYENLLKMAKKNRRGTEEAVFAMDQRLAEFPDFGHSLSKSFMTALGRSYEAYYRLRVAVDTASVSIAVVQYRARFGHHPRTLQQLIPRFLDSVPIDHYGGRPLRYLYDESGFVVYSLAYDLGDDGGMPPPDGVDLYQNGDIVFRVLQ